MTLRFLVAVLTAGLVLALAGCQTSRSPSLSLNDGAVTPEMTDQVLEGTSATLRVNGLGCPM